MRGDTNFKGSESNETIANAYFLYRDNYIT
jgi:hypothetical protein